MVKSFLNELAQYLQMYDDKQSAQFFEQIHARDRLVEDARHIGDDDDAVLLGGHLAGERESQRLISVLSFAAVLALVALWYFAT